MTAPTTYLMRRSLYPGGRNLIAQACQCREAKAIVLHVSQKCCWAGGVAVCALGDKESSLPGFRTAGRLGLGQVRRPEVGRTLVCNWPLGCACS